MLLTAFTNASREFEILADEQGATVFIISGVGVSLAGALVVLIFLLGATGPAWAIALGAALGLALTLAGAAITRGALNARRGS